MLSYLQEKREGEKMKKNTDSDMSLNLDLCLGYKPTVSMAETSSTHTPRVSRMPTTNPSDLKRDLIFLILQFLNEEKFSETVHKLEKESGVYFNMKYFEDTILVGDWDEAENYVSGFFKMDESTQSLMLFFHLRWHKYFESIIREDRGKALDILNEELRVFQPTYPQLFKEMTQYLTTPRENSALSIESHVKSLRAMAVSEINNVIISHPLLCDKLQFPKFSNKRLLTLLNQSLQGVKMLGMTEK